MFVHMCSSAYNVILQLVLILYFLQLGSCNFTLEIYKLGILPYIISNSEIHVYIIQKLE